MGRKKSGLPQFSTFDARELKVVLQYAFQFLDFILRKISDLGAVEDS
jgi:hypothetical protein